MVTGFSDQKGRQSNMTISGGGMSKNMDPNFEILRQGQNGCHLTDEIFKCIFCNEKIQSWIKVLWSFCPRDPINYNPALVQIMAWRRPGDKPLSQTIVINILIYASSGLNELMMDHCSGAETKIFQDKRGQ